jgi:hypothetical protein
MAVALVSGSARIEKRHVGVRQVVPIKEKGDVAVSRGSGGDLVQASDANVWGRGALGALTSTLGLGPLNHSRRTVHMAWAR